MAAGDRVEFTARCLWGSLPVQYRQRKIVATDLLPVYQSVIPAVARARGQRDGIDHSCGTLFRHAASMVQPVGRLNRRYLRMRHLLHLSLTRLTPGTDSSGL